jgi:hypothetical protein
MPSRCGMPKSCSARPAGFDKAVSEHDQGDQIQAGRQVQEGLLRRGNRQVSETSYRCTVNCRVGFDTLAGDETAGGRKFRDQPSLAVSW